jgi:hypothetical protein
MRLLLRGGQVQKGKGRTARGGCASQQAICQFLRQQLFLPVCSGKRARRQRAGGASAGTAQECMRRGVRGELQHRTDPSWQLNAGGLMPSVPPLFSCVPVLLCVPSRLVLAMRGSRFSSVSTTATVQAGGRAALPLRTPTPRTHTTLRAISSPAVCARPPPFGHLCEPHPHRPQPRTQSGIRRAAKEALEG